MLARRRDDGIVGGVIEGGVARGGVVSTRIRTGTRVARGQGI